MARSEPTAEASSAEIRARKRLGMAIAAMIKMIATTIKSSISENPFCARFLSVMSVPYRLLNFVYDFVGICVGPCLPVTETTKRKVHCNSSVHGSERARGYRGLADLNAFDIQSPEFAMPAKRPRGCYFLQIIQNSC